MTMMTVSDMCDTLGRRALAARLGVRPTAVSNAVVDGMFPARWFAVIADMARDKGIECPRDLFSFVEPQDGPAPAADAKEAAE